ncbi:hypothetical protein WJX74_009668 [Apatococcus lobatus]|uniref:Uncharacterized protein n=1 Tax=Apatococcus lobatus TaxID=904363 RepID=A0AAW1Q956_9CHLO
MAGRSAKPFQPAAGYVLPHVGGASGAGLGTSNAFTTSSQPAVAEDLNGVTEAAKIGQKLQKKLRQVQQLQERQGQGGLDAEQQQKLAGEQGIIDELCSMGLQP